MKLIYEKVKYTYESAEEREQHEQEMLKSGWEFDYSFFGFLARAYSRKHDEG